MNCPCPQFDLQKYKGKPYQETPCASCFMTRETNKTNKHSQLFDTDGAIQEAIDENSQAPDKLLEAQQLIQEDITPQAIELIMRACQQNFLIVLSNVVLKLTDLAKTYPALYQILHLKMQYPHLSYYQIGAKMTPPCSKQNVLYHLSHAVNLFPDLHNAIITDTRFSGGHNAIKTAADKNLQDKQIQKVRRLLYSETEANKIKTFAELTKEFKKPFKASPIEDFAQYKEDEHAHKNR